MIRVPLNSGMVKRLSRYFSLIFYISFQPKRRRYSIVSELKGGWIEWGTGLAFSSNVDGTRTVVKETTPGKWEVVETVTTQYGSRTMAIDPITHNIYLPAAKFLPLPASAPEVPKPHPTMVKDSFVILVIGK